ncbi:unnamed protein product, partial [Urochloa humidicola]
ARRRRRRRRGTRPAPRPARRRRQMAWCGSRRVALAPRGGAEVLPARRRSVVRATGGGAAAPSSVQDLAASPPPTAPRGLLLPVASSPKPKAEATDPTPARANAGGADPAQGQLQVVLLVLVGGPYVAAVMRLEASRRPRLSNFLPSGQSVPSTSTSVSPCGIRLRLREAGVTDEQPAAQAEGGRAGASREQRRGVVTINCRKKTQDPIGECLLIFL